MALKEQKKLVAEIKELRLYIGLFQEKPDLDSRNKEIYARFKKGEAVTDLATQYGLSRGTIQCICDRAAFQEKKNRDISH